MNIFNDFQSQKPEFQSIGACKNKEFRLAEFRLTDSFTNSDGTEVSADKMVGKWCDPTPQAIGLAVAIDGSGSQTFRLQGMGFVKYKDLTAQQLKSGKFKDIQGYACIKDSAGDLVRLKDEVATEKCRNILNQFVHSLGMPEGSTIDDIQSAVEEGNIFVADIVAEEYNDKVNYKMTKFRQVSTL